MSDLRPFRTLFEKNKLLFGLDKSHIINNVLTIKESCFPQQASDRRTAIAPATCCAFRRVCSYSGTGVSFSNKNLDKVPDRVQLSGIVRVREDFFDQRAFLLYMIGFKLGPHEEDRPLSWNHDRQRPFGCYVGKSCRV